MNKIKRFFTGNTKKQERPRSIFGNISSRESKKRWMEITRQAEEDQEKIIRQAEAMDAKRASSGS